MQHYALQRDIEWIVVDASRGFGNQQLLPTGFLREPMSRLQGANVIYHEKAEMIATDNNKAQAKRLTMHLQADKLQLLWSSAAEIDDSTVAAKMPMPPMPPTSNSRVHAVSGIGYPQRFFDTLLSLGFDVIGHAYPDHYDFSLHELLQYTEQPIIVTSKDAVKIKALLIDATSRQPLSKEYQELVSRLWVLPVTAVLSNSCYDSLQQQLKALNIDINNG